MREFNRNAHGMPMRHGSLVLLLAAVVGALSLTSGTPAHAATITISDPSCLDFTLSGTAGDRTLTCVKQGCTATASPSEPGLNDPVTLGVTCTPTARQFTWQLLGDNPNGCPLPPQTSTTVSTQQLAAPGTLRNCVYRVTATNGAFTATSDVAVNWTNQPPPAPPSGCTIGRTPASGNVSNAGGGVSLSGTCSGGGPVTVWGWRKNGNSWQAVQNPTDTLPANTAATAVTTTYTLTACNTGGCAAPAQTTFTVAGTTPVGFCNQYPNVIIGDLPWVNNASLRTDTLGGLKSDGVFVAKVVVSAGQVAKDPAGGFFSVEYGGSPTFGEMTVSLQPCDFRVPGDSSGVNGPIMRTYGQSLGQNFGTGTPLPRLAPGATYFVNIRHQDPLVGGTCGAFECNRLLEMKLY
jgi:hypothetical protein